VTYLKNQFEVSERRACQVMSMHRSSYRHQGHREIDAVHAEVVNLSQRYPYWGYRKIYDLIDRDQYPVGRERVRLIRRREGLQVVQKRRKKRVLGQTTQWVHRATHPNHVWSYGFVHDQTIDGHSLRCLTIVDEFTRESLAVECARSLTSHDVVRTLIRLVRRHGRPQCIRSDNGPEFIAKAVKNWLKARSIGTHYIEPGSPWQNAYGESFNSILRTTCLDRWAFESVMEARTVIGEWRVEYNTIRPHGSLSGRSPAQFIKDWASAHRETSNQRKAGNT
jgi:putative transposase